MSESRSTSSTASSVGSTPLAGTESGRASSQRASAGSGGPGGALDEADPPSPPWANERACQIHQHLEMPDTDPPLVGWLDRQFHQVTRHAHVQGGQIILSIVDDAAMSELHQRFKGEAGPTDVLTFDLRDTLDQPLDAEIVICLDEATRQARQRGYEARLEVLLYAVHGLLHLLGEDDHEPGAAAQMHRREDSLLEAVGVGAVYKGRGQQQDMAQQDMAAKAATP